MKPRSIHPAISALFVGWAIIYLLYAALGVWLTTGPGSLDSSASAEITASDIITATIWIGLSAAQLIAAHILNKKYRPWLFWVVLTLVIASIAMLIGPVLFQPAS